MGVGQNEDDGDGVKNVSVCTQWMVMAMEMMNICEEGPSLGMGILVKYGTKSK